MRCAGTHDFLWRDFDPETFFAQREAYMMPNGRRPHGSDQAWYSVRLGGGINLFQDPDVVQYRQWRDNPGDPAIIFFAGHNKPWSAHVAEHHPELWSLWRCYDAIRVKRSGGSKRCVVLGDQPHVWDDVAAALSGRDHDGVVATPEAAMHWPVQVDAVALTVDAARQRAIDLGFSEIVVCGAAG